MVAHNKLEAEEGDARAAELHAALEAALNDSESEEHAAL